MKNNIKNKRLIEEYSPAQGGVFRISDLKTILNELHIKSLYRRIDQIVEAGVLKRFCRGFYITETPDPEILSQKLAPQSYISMTNILSENQMIGISPKNYIEAVKVGKNKFYQGAGIQIRHYGIKEELFFGYEKMKGLNFATPEKAWLDTLYFYQHGAKFLFSPFEDVNIEMINVAEVRKSLKQYANPKFVKFIEGMLP